MYNIDRPLKPAVLHGLKQKTLLISTVYRQIRKRKIAQLFNRKSANFGLDLATEEGTGYSSSHHGRFMHC